MDNFENWKESLRIQAEHHGDPLSGISLLNHQFSLMSISDVYHYTDINGFISIMQKRELWSSHIAFMNDTSEYLHGKALFQDHLSKKILNSPTQERKFLQQVKKSLDREISDGYFSLSSRDVFSLSFSYDGDSLEMWRGYGKNCGIAIGFSYNQCSSNPGMSLIREEMYEKLLHQYGEKPENVCPDFNTHFLPLAVLYDDNKKEALVNRTIELGLSFFRHRLKDSENTSLASIASTQFLSDMIFYFIPFFKHCGFSGEKECRVIDHFVKRNENHAYRIYYRERGGIVLPYIKYRMMDKNCRPFQQMPIHEIVVGPGSKQHKLVESVKYFLEKNNMNYLVDKVRASSIPYIEI